MSGWVLYIGAAKHCVDFVGQRVSLEVYSPETGSTATIDVGHVWLMSATNDFALVAIDGEWNDWVSPTLTYWGGPVGIDTAASAGTPVTCTGHPEGARDVPRTGVVIDRTPDSVTWSCPTISGDSGGPVTTAADGLALAAVDTAFPGSNVHGSVVGAGGSGPSIQSMLAIGGLPLATCPTRTPWQDPGCPPL